MRLWWRGNDLIRQGEASQLSADQEENLEHFLQSLSEDDLDQRLLKAEALRELSRFDEARRLLETEFPSDYAHAVQRIRELASNGDCKVATYS